MVEHCEVTFKVTCADLFLQDQEMTASQTEEAVVRSMKDEANMFKPTITLTPLMGSDTDLETIASKDVVLRISDINVLPKL